MFRQYRELQRGEFIVIGGDCSQGGEDSNVSQFISKTKCDVPLVLEMQGVAAQMTPEIHKAAESICDITGVPPVIGFERNMGGASEMERLRVLNTKNKYELFVMPVIGQTEDNETKKLGWDTNEASRPILIGDLKNIVDVHGITIYDHKTIQELFWFIINRQGKPEAMKGKHDDHVIGLGVGWQMYQRCEAPLTDTQIEEAIDDIPIESWRRRKDY